MKILQQVKKILLKRGEIDPQFLQYFQYISKLKSPVTYKFAKCGCWNYVFLTFANLICRATDMGLYQVNGKNNLRHFFFPKSTNLTENNGHLMHID